MPLKSRSNRKHSLQLNCTMSLHIFNPRRKIDEKMRETKDPRADFRLLNLIRGNV